MQIQGGIKYFKGAQIYQKFLFRVSKSFNKIELNYPGGPNISIYRTEGNFGGGKIWRIHYKNTFGERKFGKFPILRSSSKKYLRHSSLRLFL